jgi:hypothetical protein
MEYWCDTASMELALGNTGEALKLIADAEAASQGGNALCVNQGAFERLAVFRAYHARGAAAARRLACAGVAKFRGRHVLAYMEALAAMAWLEKQTEGLYSDWVRCELGIFDSYGAVGKWDIIAAEGFLDQRPTGSPKGSLSQA